MKTSVILVTALTVVTMLIAGCATPGITATPNAPGPASSPAASQPTPSLSPSPAKTAPISTPVPSPTVTASTGTIEVRVTDAPPAKDEVTSILLTVSAVAVHKVDVGTATKPSGASDNKTPGKPASDNTTSDNQTQPGTWITVKVSQPYTFDLLKVKGLEATLTTDNISTGKYTQVRLTIDKVEVGLSGKAPQAATLPSGELKIVQPFEIAAGKKTVLLLDFDADKMVDVTGAGKIMVSPVVKLTVK